MQTVKSVSWVRMVLAFAAVLIVAGSGMALAIGPNPTYVPQSSVLLGPSTVAPGATASYTLEVTFVGGADPADFPPTTGALFSAVSRHNHQWRRLHGPGYWSPRPRCRRVLAERRNDFGEPHHRHQVIAIRWRRFAQAPQAGFLKGRSACSGAKHLFAFCALWVACGENGSRIGSRQSPFPPRPMRPGAITQFLTKGICQNET